MFPLKGPNQTMNRPGQLTPLQAFLQNHPEAHPLFQPDLTPCGGLSLFRPDWMHVKSLGTDSNLLGSCIAYMAKEVLPGSIDENVALMWEDISAHYRANNTPCRLTHLTFNMVKNDPFNRLSAKAMEIRWLLPAMAAILRPWTNNHVEVAWLHRLVLLSSTMDDIVFGCKDLVLSHVQGQTLKGCIFEFNKLLTQLARSFIAKGKAYCNYTPKNHYLCHIGIDAAMLQISPRLGLCLQGEDFMSIVKSLTVASSRGVDATKLFNKVAEKYLRGLDLLLLHV